METLQLIAHPAQPPLRVTGVAARALSLDANWCVLRWKVDGARDVVVPRPAGRKRQDGLWQTTCFELFIHPHPAHAEPVEARAPTPDPAPTVSRLLRRAQDERGDEEGAGVIDAYTEFNFAPSERWAAYDFTGYRAGMTERPIARAPVITPRRGADVLFCDVAIPTAVLPPLPWRYGFTAVLEEAGGVKSYWAMAHARDRPDFHDPACHAALLAAPHPPPPSPRA